jgi:hypothetical protein
MMEVRKEGRNVGRQGARNVKKERKVKEGRSERRKEGRCWMEGR